MKVAEGAEGGITAIDFGRWQVGSRNTGSMTLLMLMQVSKE